VEAGTRVSPMPGGMRPQSTSPASIRHSWQPATGPRRRTRRGRCHRQRCAALPSPQDWYCPHRTDPRSPPRHRTAEQL
jgi:hypothetical protein